MDKIKRHFSTFKPKKIESIYIPIWSEIIFCTCTPALYSFQLNLIDIQMRQGGSLCPRVPVNDERRRRRSHGQGGRGPPRRSRRRLHSLLQVILLSFSLSISHSVCVCVCVCVSLSFEHSYLSSFLISFSPCSFNSHFQ